MKIKELIKEVEELFLYEAVISTDLRDEIIEKLRQFNEFKQLLLDVVDPLTSLYEFLDANLDEEDDLTGVAFG